MGRPRSENPKTEQVNIRLTPEAAAFLDAVEFIRTVEGTGRAGIIRTLIDRAQKDPSINTPEVAAAQQAKASFIGGEHAE